MWLAVINSNIYSLLLQYSSRYSADRKRLSLTEIFRSSLRRSVAPEIRRPLHRREVRLDIPSQINII